MDAISLKLKHIVIISIFYPEMDAIRQASYNDPNQLQHSNGWAFMDAI